jgi:hypothetical protein
MYQNAQGNQRSTKDPVLLLEGSFIIADNYIFITRV